MTKWRKWEWTVYKSEVSECNGEQTEPGVFCAASPAGIPGPLQGTGQLQGRAHHRDKENPQPQLPDEHGDKVTKKMNVLKWWF